MSKATLPAARCARLDCGGGSMSKATLPAARSARLDCGGGSMSKERSLPRAARALIAEAAA
jgi:hypothetical protein